MASIGFCPISRAAARGAEPWGVEVEGEVDAARALAGAWAEDTEVD